MATGPQGEYRLATKPMQAIYHRLGQDTVCLLVMLVFVVMRPHICAVPTESLMWCCCSNINSSNLAHGKIVVLVVQSMPRRCSVLVADLTSPICASLSVTSIIKCCLHGRLAVIT